MAESDKYLQLYNAVIVHLFTWAINLNSYCTHPATSAASLHRQVEHSPWNITNFVASSNRFSLITTYRFDITDRNGSAYCVALVDTTPDISSVPITDCTDPIYSFAFGSAWNMEEAGFNLQIGQGDPEGTSCGAPLTHCVYKEIKILPVTDVETVVDPARNPFGNYDQLNTPADFKIARNGVHI